jgi:hypothetical protein
MISLGKTHATASWVALLSLLAALLAIGVAHLFPGQLGIDLYHPWGIPKAREAVGTTPYADLSGYGRWFSEAAQSSTDAKLRETHTFWEKRRGQTIEPTGTPLFYASFGFLPRDFARAHFVFILLQIVATAAGVFMLARLRGVRPLPAICLALLVEITFSPFVHDARSGNVNSLQFLFLASMVYAASKKLYLRHPAFDILYLGALAVFLLFKPNTGLVVLGLAIHFAVVRGPRRFLAAAVAAVVPVALAWAYSAWFFGDAGAWSEWWSYTHGRGGGTLMYRSDLGNQSLTMMLSERAAAYGAIGYGVLLGGVLAAALLVALNRGQKGSPGAGLRRLFSDPLLAASLGVLFTFATSPLMWPSYHLLALIPYALLFGADGRTGFRTWCVVASYAAESVPLLMVIVATHEIQLVSRITLAFWLPLVPAMLVHVARIHRPTEAGA